MALSRPKGCPVASVGWAKARSAAPMSLTAWASLRSAHPTSNVPQLAERDRIAQRIHRRDAVLPHVARGAVHQIYRAGVEPHGGAVRSSRCGGACETCTATAA